MQNRREDIDGLRAFAVLSIVLFHLDVPGFVGGYVGVDIFFVISGFLITTNFARGQSIAQFYERRARRILPALLLMLAVTSVVALVVLMPRDLAAFGRILMGTLLFVSNILLWMDIGYFDELAAFKPLLHTWSLAVEEQFYLLFPLFLVLCRRYARSMLWPIVALLALSFAGAAWMVTKAPSAAFYLPAFRAWELLLGATLALWRPSHRQDSVLALTGFGLIALAVFAYDDATTFPGLAAAVPCLGAAFLLHAGSSKPAGAILKFPPLVFFGRISYSLYLWHWPVVVFYRYLGYDLTAWSIGALFVVTTALAWLSWRFVEEPIRTRKWMPTFATPAVAGTAAGVLAGALMLQGLPGRFPERVVKLDGAALDRSPDPQGCHNRSPERVEADDLCVIGDASKSPTWLLWGDSHGQALLPVFDAALRNNGEAALVATRAGCIPLPGVERVGYGKCTAFAAAVGRHLERRSMKVIGVAHWTGYKGAHLSDGKPGTSEEIIARGLSRAPFTVIVDPIPGAPVAVPRSLALHAAFGLPAVTPFKLTEYQARNAMFLKAAEGRPRVSLWKEICASGTCVVEREGLPIYFDGNHPSASNFSFAVPLVASALRSAGARQIVVSRAVGQ